MPKLPENAVPSYRLHKQSGQAIVTLSGRDFLLGPFNSAASRREYARVVGEWIADGRRLHHRAELGRTVNELILSYWRYAKSYYCKNGTPTSEIGALEHALVPLKELYGNTLAAEFRPLALQALRERMIGRGWARKTINGHIQRVKRMFKWAVARELVPPDVHHGLSAVEGLRRGRSAAKETEPVRPVPEGQVDAVIAALSPSLAKLIALQSQRDEASTTVATNPAAEVRLRQLDAEIDRLAARVPDESPVAAMVQLQRLTGMRSGELVVMRSADVDVSGDNWVYMPPSHKTEHHDRPRSIYLGPRARQVLRPFLGRTCRRTCSTRAGPSPRTGPVSGSSARARSSRRSRTVASEAPGARPETITIRPVIDGPYNTGASARACRSSTRTVSATTAQPASAPCSGSRPPGSSSGTLRRRSPSSTRSWTATPLTTRWHVPDDRRSAGNSDEIVPFPGLRASASVGTDSTVPAAATTAPVLGERKDPP